MLYKFSHRVSSSSQPRGRVSETQESCVEGFRAGAGVAGADGSKTPHSSHLFLTPQPRLPRIPHPSPPVEISWGFTQPHPEESLKVRGFLCAHGAATGARVFLSGKSQTGNSGSGPVTRSPHNPHQTPTPPDPESGSLLFLTEISPPHTPTRTAWRAGLRVLKQTQASLSEKALVCSAQLRVISKTFPFLSDKAHAGGSLSGLLEQEVCDLAPHREATPGSSCSRCLDGVPGRGKSVPCALWHPLPCPPYPHL